MAEYNVDVIKPFHRNPAYRKQHLSRAYVEVWHPQFGRTAFILDVFKQFVGPATPEPWKRNPWVYQVRHTFFGVGGRVLFEGRARTQSSARALALVEAKRAFGRGE